MPKVQIHITKDTNIRGEIAPAGTLLIEGELPDGIQLPDLNKAMKHGNTNATTIGAAKADPVVVKKKAVRKASAKKK